MELQLTPTTTLPGIKLGPLLKGMAANKPTAPDEGFSGAFKTALKSVSAAQNKANGLQRELQMDNPNVSLEQTMVAMQKAQIGFTSALHVRNRMVQAYTDIMNMQV
jgi:flagellar hook-basal body complex protein FliE